jgi:short subunit fatty acids transporter
VTITVWKSSDASVMPLSAATPGGHVSPAASDAAPSAAPDTTSWYSSVFSGSAVASRLPRSTRVVRPHKTAAAMPSASPSHCRGPAEGDIKPSKKAQTTPAKAVTRPSPCQRSSRSVGTSQGMPSATTKGAR